MNILSRNTTTALQGLSILLIISCHFIGGGYGIRYLTPFGGIGVAIFLFVSGFGLAESNKSKGIRFFWEKKFVRILIPYLIWIPFFWLIVKVIPLNCTLTFPIPRYWYREYLFLMYVIFWLFAKWLPKYLIVGLACMGLVSFFVFPCLQAEQSLSFLLGVVASKYKAKLERITTIKSVILAIVLFVVGGMFLAVKQLPAIRMYGENSMVMKLVQIMMKCSFAISLVFVVNLIVESGKVSWGAKLLSTFGAYSLEVYLVQMTFWNSIYHSWAKLLLYLIITVAVSILIHHLSIIVSQLIVKKYSKTT